KGPAGARRSAGGPARPRSEVPGRQHDARDLVRGLQGSDVGEARLHPRGLVSRRELRGEDQGGDQSHGARGPRRGRGRPGGVRALRQFIAARRLLRAGVLGEGMLSARFLAAAAASVACGPAFSTDADGVARARERMVAQQIAARNVTDERTLAALRKVPRHLFVPPSLAGEAYDATPLPIGPGPAVCEPYIVGFMTQALGLRSGAEVLEVGTGSGYQAAVLAEIAAKVYAIEIMEPLAREARERLARL